MTKDKLWVRLSLAFGIVVVVAAFGVGLTPILLGRYYAQDRFIADFLEARGGLLDRLAVYYQREQSWDNIQPILVGAQSAIPGEDENKSFFFLADHNKKIVYHPNERHHGRSMQDMRNMQARIMPIKVEGKTVGYLGTLPRQSNRPPNPLPFLERLTQFVLMVAVIGGVGGITLGVLMSRSLTAPLTRLAEAARAIGSRDLSQRVEPKGTAELVEVAHAFNEMAKDLEEAETLRRNLVADVAHELRTPLTVLQGNLRAILDGVYPLDTSEVSRLYDQTRLLSRLVNDLHELAQAEAHQLPLSFQETNLLTLVEHTAATFAPIAESENVTLKTDLPTTLAPIQADKTRLTQVLHNLLVNALRHTPSGGDITLSIKTTSNLSDKNGSICLNVSDTGEGIPPEHIPHIFDRFYRADPARSRAKGGTGLGLAIARAIVKEHGGQITATSSGIFGEGTTFKIELPTIAH